MKIYSQTVIAAGAALFAAILSPLCARDHSLVQLHELGGIYEYVAPNKMKVILLPDLSTPSLTVAMTYNVGSKEEGRGETGMAHMLEHLLMNGSANFDSLWEEMAKRAVDFNADTWLDRTRFFETFLASDKNLDFALQVEADRMHTSTFDEDDLAKEMEVITNEFQMIENEPATLLSMGILSTAYTWHNYGKATIGNLVDINNYPLANIRSFYEKHYTPDNATLLIAGRFDRTEALRKIDRYFGPIQNSDRRDSFVQTAEAAQQGAREVTINHVDSENLVGLAWHSPPAAHDDAAPLQVLLEIMTNNSSGPFYDNLIATGMATSIEEGWSEALLVREPGVLEIAIAGLAGGGASPGNRDLIGQIERICREEITDEDVELAKARLLRKYRKREVEPGDLAIDLTNWIAAGDWRLYFTHVERLSKVTAVQVLEVAERYIRPANRTAGFLVSVDSLESVIVPGAPDLEPIMAVQSAPSSFHTPATPPVPAESLQARTITLKIEPGLTVSLLPRPNRSRQVCAEFRFHYGNEKVLRGKREAMRLLPRLLMRGTKRLEYRELSREIDMLQSEIRIAGGDGVISASVESDGDHVAGAIRLLGEMMRRPAFREDQFEMVRSQRLVELEAGLGNPVDRCFDALRQRLFPWPKGSIHHIAGREELIEITRSLTREEIVDCYNDLLGAGHVEIALTGTFETGDVTRALADAFDSWNSPIEYERINEPYRNPDPGEESIHTPGKSVAILSLGTVLELGQEHPDYAAIKLASYIFCEKNRARIDNRLRHADGLSYHVSGAFEADLLDQRSYLYTYAFCSPENLDVARVAMEEEFATWVDEGVSAIEIEEASASLADEFALHMANDSNVASELVQSLASNRKFGRIFELQDRVRNLTVEEVNEALNRQLGDAQLVIILTGDRSPEGIDEG